MATHQGTPVKYEKLTFTPSRLIEIERTRDDELCAWGNVVLKPGREVTFGPFRDFRDFIPDGDWYIDCGRVYRVLHFDVERVYAQLSMEADVAAKAAPAAEVRTRSCVEAATLLRDHCDAEALRHAEREKWEAAIVSDVVARTTADQRDMVSTVIASQVAAGGVDTEGTRHEAERWCAWLCECVCEGMRATTEQSALRLTRVIPGDPGKVGDCVPCRHGVVRGVMPRGKPLGRP